MTEMEKIFENAPVCSAYVALCGRFLSCNKSFCKLLGYRESELKQLNFKTITHQEDLDLSLVNVEKLLRDKINSYSIEKRYIHKDKRIKWVLLSVCLIKDDEGRPDCFFTQMQDISDKKQVEQELREAQSRYDRAIDGAGVGLWDWEIEEDKLYSSPTLLSMLGLKKHDQIPTRKDSEQYIHPDDIELRRAAMDNHLKNNTPFDLEYRLRHKSGKYIWVNSRGRAVRDELGRPIKMSGSLIDITEKKRAEQELEEQNEVFRSIFADSNIGIVILSLDGKIMKVNPKIIKESGYSAKEIIGKSFLDFLHDDEDKSEVIKKFKVELPDSLLPETMLRRYKNKKGVEVCLLTTSSLINDSKGMPSYWVVQAQDITMQKIAEEKIKESEIRYELAMRGASMGLWDYDLVEDTVYWSDRLKAILGLPKKFSLFSMKQIEEYIHPDDISIRRRAIKDLLENHKRYNTEFRIRHEKGHYIWMLVKGYAIWDEKGKAIRMTGSLEVIDKRKKAESELAEKTNTFVSVFDHSPIGMVLVSLGYKYIRVNNSFCKIVGYSKKELLKMGFEDITPKEELQRDYDGVGAMIRGKIKNYQCEKRYFHKNGNIIWVLLSSALIRDISGKPLYLATQVQDITKRKAIEQELQQNKERLDRAVRGSNIGLWDWDIKSDKIYWSSRIGEILGIKESEFVPYLGMIEERVHPSDRKMRKKMFEDHLQYGKKFDFQYRMRHKNGHYIWLHTRGEVVRDKSGKPIMMAGSVDDITERKQAEVKIDEYTKELERINADLDSFAYIASHDLKEPIRGLCNNAQFLKDDYENVLDESGLRRIDRILFLCSRMQKLVNDLLHFARLKNQDMIIKKVDLNYVIKDIESTLQNIFDYTNAKIIVPKKLPQVTCDEIIVTELYRNLITNGIKYNTKKEKIIEIGYREEIINKETYVPQYVFYVKDNGIGIEKKHFEDIFRIFKRLEDEEEPWKGTGIGLTFVRKIVERHGGKIWLESELKKGTTFYFTLS